MANNDLDDFELIMLLSQRFDHRTYLVELCLNPRQRWLRCQSRPLSVVFCAVSNTVNEVRTTTLLSMRQATARCSRSVRSTKVLALME